jgi:uncharacterized protein YjgD (DUF1641 family)
LRVDDLNLTRNPKPATRNPPTLMAQPLDYTPPPHPNGEAAFTADDDLARLVETLHASGTLRLLNGLFARLEDVAAVVLKGLDTDAGRRGLANLLLLSKLLGRLDPDGLDRFIAALDRGLEAAARRLDTEADPPGPLRTLGRLRDPDIRRGLDAVLALLGTLGAELHDPTVPPHSTVDGTPSARP